MNNFAPIRNYHWDARLVKLDAGEHVIDIILQMQ